MPWHTLLVLGGAGSGHDEYAATCAAQAAGDGDVHRVATEPGAGLAALAQALVPPQGDGRALLVAEIAVALPTGGQGDRGPEATAGLAALTDALMAQPGPTVVVSSEASMAPPATTAPNRRLVEALGTVNRALADAADAVVLVVAGQPLWLKGGSGATGAAVPAVVPAVVAPAPPAEDAPEVSLADLSGLRGPEGEYGDAAEAHLATLGPVGFGALTRVVRFAAASQRRRVPAGWSRVRAVVLHGDHPGEAAAGAVAGEERAAALRAGTAPLAALAAPLGVDVQLVEAPPAGPLEQGLAVPEQELEPLLQRGWQLAQAAADEGVDALVLGAIGAGAETAATAVTAVVSPSVEAPALLPQVRTADGRVDDQAWIRRCAAVRDAVHRTRSHSRTTGRPALAALGGPDMAVTTGLILGAAARRTPVLIDGPVGAAAALVARSLAAASRHWCLVPDTGGQPLVRRAAEVLGLTPLFDLGLTLGEGAGSLATLPVLQSALTLAGSLPVATAGGGAADPETEDTGAAADPGGTGGTGGTGDPGGTGGTAAPDPPVADDAPDRDDGSDRTAAPDADA